MSRIGLNQLEGGQALCDWFGSSPTFHDATLSDLELRQGAVSLLVAHIFKSGPDVDADGYYVQRNHAVVTFALSGLVDVELHNIVEAGIMDGLDIERDAEGTTLTFGSSYGVHGCIKAKVISLSFVPTEGACRRSAP